MSTISGRQRYACFVKVAGKARHISLSSRLNIRAADIVQRHLYYGSMETKSRLYLWAGEASLR